MHTRAMIGLLVGGALLAASESRGDTIAFSSSVPSGIGAVVAGDLPLAGAASSTTPNYYSDNFRTHGAIPAETFTTGSSATQLGSVTFLDTDNAGNGFASGNVVDLVVTPVTGSGTYGTGTLYSVTSPGGEVKNDYITYGLSTPLPLLANTTYMIGMYTSLGYTGFGIATTGGTSTQQLAMATPTVNTAPAGGGTFATTSTDLAAFQVTTLPEPASLTIAAIGAVGLLLRRRHQHS